MKPSIEELKKKWREAFIAEQQARWILEDATSYDLEKNNKEKEFKDSITKLKEAATGSAVHAAVGGIVGAVVYWILWRKRP